jgi:hypothetical protein
MCVCVSECVCVSVSVSVCVSVCVYACICYVVYIYMMLYIYITYYVYFALGCHWPRHQSLEQLSVIHNYSQTARVDRDLDLSSPLSPVQSTQRLTRFGDMDRDMDRDKSMSLSPYLLPSKPARVSVSVHPHPPATLTLCTRPPPAAIHVQSCSNPDFMLSLARHTPRTRICINQ